MEPFRGSSGRPNPSGKTDRQTDQKRGAKRGEEEKEENEEKEETQRRGADLGRRQKKKKQ